LLIIKTKFWVQFLIGEIDSSICTWRLVGDVTSRVKCVSINNLLTNVEDISQNVIKIIMVDDWPVISDKLTVMNREMIGNR
ncbi:uncharacterized protein METZ01_LOCUS175221, partial [marine metagenome]